MSPFRFADAAGPIAPRASASSDMGLSPTSGLSDLVSDAPPAVGEVPSEYAIPIPPADWPPDNVVDAFRPDDTAVVVPQPRYPAAEPSSRISISFPGDPPTAGNVGSLLGLYPYSSTSFLLNSSASLRCFRFRQKNNPASTIRATATIGTTTATATVPPWPSPPLLELFDPDCKPAVLVPDVEEDVPVPVSLVGKVAVDVLITVDTDCGFSELVMTDVMIVCCSVVGCCVVVGA